MAAPFQKLMEHRTEKLYKGSENMNLGHGVEVGAGYEDLDS